jgi:heterodisulfide reductase subunit C
VSAHKVNCVFIDSIRHLVKMPRRISANSGFEDTDCLTTLAATYEKILNQINEIGRSLSRTQRRRSELEIITIVKFAKIGLDELRNFQVRFPDFNLTSGDAQGEKSSTFSSGAAF